MNVYLDTETNGLNDEAEIIQIGVINDNGSVLIDTLIQCQGDIPTEVSAINGITKNDLSCAPTFPQVFDKICETLKNAEVVLIYNAEFDLRLLKQTSKRYGLQMPDFNASCVMLGYAHKFNNGKRRKLVDACDDLLIYTADVILHSAVGDCELTRRLNNKMKLEIAEEQLQREKRRKSREYRRKIKAKKLAYIPDNWSEYPDFGAQNRPSGYKTLSQISLKEIHKYEFAGVCCDTYGGSGYLFKPVNKQFREI